MQHFFRLFFVFFMVIVTSPVLASGNVRIGEAVINFQSGSIDPETLNGEISGITINMADGRTSYADRLTIYSTSDGDTLTLDQLTIINMIMEDYDGSLAMSQLDWRGLVITGGADNIGVIFSEDFNPENIAVTGEVIIKGVGFGNNNGESVSIDEILVNSIPVTVDAMPDVPLQEGEIQINNLVFVPAADVDYRPEYDAFLRQIGREAISSSLTIRGQIDERPDRVNSSSDVLLDVDGMGQVSLELDIGMPNATLQLLNSMVGLQSANQEEYMTVLLTGLLFNQSSIVLRDNGLLDVIMLYQQSQTGMSKDSMVNIIMDQLAMTLGLYAPQTYAMVSRPIRSFLQDGGTLSIEMRPASPVPATSFLGFAAVPDMAMSVLGIDVRHQPSN